MHRVDRGLVAGIGVDRGHEAMVDADGVVDHEGHRRQAVGGAGGVGDDDAVGGLQLVVVDAIDHRKVFVGRRGRDQNLLGARGQMLAGLFTRGENAGAFHGDIDLVLAQGSSAGSRIWVHGCGGR